MSFGVFALVICAAFFHALWNSMVKGGDDKKTAMAAVVLGHFPFALGVLFFVPMPDAASYPFIVLGAVLHFLYQNFLLHAYRAGDLTQVYPIARGVAPLIVTVVSVIFLGATLGQGQIMGIAFIVAGIFALMMVRKEGGKIKIKALGLALGTGVMIASYSIVDGLGARQAGTAFGFYAWLSIINTFLMAIYLAGTAKGRRIDAFISLPLGFALVAGGVSYAAYAIITWAFTQAPIALVSALRETSIIFAVLIGVFVLKEKFNLVKLLSVFLTVCGVVILRFVQ